MHQKGISDGRFRCSWVWIVRPPRLHCTLKASAVMNQKNKKWKICLNSFACNYGAVCEHGTVQPFQSSTICLILCIFMTFLMLEHRNRNVISCFERILSENRKLFVVGDGEGITEKRVWFMTLVPQTEICRMVGGMPLSSRSSKWVFSETISYHNLHKWMQRICFAAPIFMLTHTPNHCSFPLPHTGRDAFIHLM